MPAWSVPGTHSARSPNIRRQRMMMSVSVCSNMWPMCSRPVTLGGGSRMVKGCAADFATILRFGIEEPLLDPVLGPAVFNGGGIVGFGQFAWHYVYFFPLVNFLTIAQHSQLCCASAVASRKKAAIRGLFQLRISICLERVELVETLLLLVLARGLFARVVFALVGCRRGGAGGDCGRAPDLTSLTCDGASAGLSTAGSAVASAGPTAFRPPLSGTAVAGVASCWSRRSSGRRGGCSGRIGRRRSRLGAAASLLEGVTISAPTPVPPLSGTFSSRGAGAGWSLRGGAVPFSIAAEGGHRSFRRLAHRNVDRPPGFAC